MWFTCTKAANPEDGQRATWQKHEEAGDENGFASQPLIVASLSSAFLAPLHGQNVPYFMRALLDTLKRG